jgi:precorrin-2 dehydrogenase / sirohydrochlorin ferrochelatase
MMVPHFPIFLSLTDRVCLVVGGGSVAERKIRGLLPYGPRIQVIAEMLSDWIETQLKQGTIQFLGNRYHHALLDGVDLVFAATSDPSLNRMVAMDARNRRLWCNMATDPEEGSFVLPSVFRRGALSIAVSTGGASPAFAARICRNLKNQYGPEWESLMDLMARLRAVILSKGLHTKQSQEILRSIAALPLQDWIKAGEVTQIVNAIRNICEPWLTLTEVQNIVDQTWKQSS